MVAKPLVLVINSGSSSIKFAAFELLGDEPQRVFAGALERIDLESGRFVAGDNDGHHLIDQAQELPNHIVALDLLLTWIDKRTSDADIVAAGHKVAHGGPDCDCALRATPALEARLKRLIPLAPRHLPHNLAGISAGLWPRRRKRT